MVKHPKIDKSKYSKGSFDGAIGASDFSTIVVGAGEAPNNGFIAPKLLVILTLLESQKISSLIKIIERIIKIYDIK